MQPCKKRVMRPSDEGGITLPSYTQIKRKPKANVFPWQASKTFAITHKEKNRKAYIRP